MRSKTIDIETEGMTDEQIAEAVRTEAPWASKWALVEGGVKVWESVADYETWMAQA
jgi:hypothetical protein